MPPTDNHVYFNLPGAGRVLSKAARQYKSRVKEITSRVAVTEKCSFREHVPYRVRILIYMNLYTKGWPKKAKWRFRKADATNRTKLLLDAVAEAIGVDDRHFVDLRIRKEDTDKEPYVIITVEEVCTGQ